MGILYVAAALRRAGHHVRLVEAEDAASLLRRLDGMSTDLLAFSVTTGLHRHYLQWARAAKGRRPVITLFGGAHPTFFPEMIEQPGVDAIVIGEGEAAAPELLEALSVGDGRPVAGTVYHQDGRLIRGPLRPPEQQLDRLPMPERRMFEQASAARRAFPVRVFLASRGCPYRCAYCFNRTLNDMYRGRSRAVRVRSPAAVVDEILDVRDSSPLRMIWFLDANFVVSRSWVEELCSRLRHRVGLPFYCKVRPNMVDARLARTLALGGCTGIGMGLECGDDHLRNDVLERYVSREQIVAACRYLREAGIHVMTFNMVGLPGETYEMARATVDLNIEAGVDYAMATVFQPYPRTVLAEWAEAAGHFHGDYEAIDTNYYSTCQMRELVPGDRRRIENLQRLFDLAVGFPWIRRNLDRLVSLDAPRLYTEIFKRWHRKNFFELFYERYDNPTRRALEGVG